MKRRAWTLTLLFGALARSSRSFLFVNPSFNGREENLVRSSLLRERNQLRIDLGEEDARNIAQNDIIGQTSKRNGFGSSPSTSRSGISRSGFLNTMLAVPLLASTAANAATESMASRESSLWYSSGNTPTIVSTATTAPASTTATSGMSTSTVEESISGFLAGAALATSKTLVKYPLDTATVRLQMPGSIYSVTELPTLLDGCYRGVTTPLVFNIPAGAIFFAVKDATKKGLADFGLPKWQRTSLAVAAALIPYWIVRNPSEVIKTRQQANISRYTNVTALQAWRQVGIDAALSDQNPATAYYTGYWENVLYAFPADVIKFLVYDRFAGASERLSPAEGALAGAAATAVAQLVTTPLDVVRNRVMAKSRSSSHETDVDERSANLSYVETLLEIGRNEGAAGLLAGATPRVAKAMLSGAIQFATYEETKQELAKFFVRRRS